MRMENTLIYPINAEKNHEIPNKNKTSACHTYIRNIAREH